MELLRLLLRLGRLLLDALLIEGVIFDVSQDFLHRGGRPEFVALWGVLGFSAGLLLLGRIAESDDEPPIVEKPFSVAHFHIQVIAELLLSEGEQVFALDLVLVEGLLAVFEFYGLEESEHLFDGPLLESLADALQFG